MAESEELKSLLMKVEEESEKAVISSTWQEAQPTEKFLRVPPLTTVADAVAVLPCLPGLSLRSSTVGELLLYLSQASYLSIYIFLSEDSGCDSR